MRSTQSFPPQAWAPSAAGRTTAAFQATNLDRRVVATHVTGLSITNGMQVDISCHNDVGRGYSVHLKVEVPLLN